jgi:hypothetical protein
MYAIGILDILLYLIYIQVSNVYILERRAKQYCINMSDKWSLKFQICNIIIQILVYGIFLYGAFLQN